MKNLKHSHALVVTLILGSILSYNLSKYLFSDIGAIWVVTILALFLGLISAINISWQYKGFGVQEMVDEYIELYILNKKNKSLDSEDVEIRAQSSRVVVPEALWVREFRYALFLIGSYIFLTVCALIFQMPLSTWLRTLANFLLVYSVVMFFMSFFYWFSSGRVTKWYFNSEEFKDYAKVKGVPYIHLDKVLEVAIKKNWVQR